MSIDRMFSRRQVLRYGIAAVATAGGGVAAFAQDQPGHVPLPSPQDLLKWASEQAQRGAGKTFSESVRRGYLQDRFFDAFDNRLKTAEVTVEDLIVLGGLSHQWGALAAQNAALDGSDEILVRHCKAATVFMQDSEEFQRICSKAAPAKGRWCEEIGG